MTDYQMNQLILGELTALRSLATSTVERLSSLEAKLETVLGDSQPGRLTLVENKVSDLQHWRWRIAGIATGLSTVAAGILHFWK